MANRSTFLTESEIAEELDTDSEWEGELDLLEDTQPEPIQGDLEDETSEESDDGNGDVPDWIKPSARHRQRPQLTFTGTHGVTANVDENSRHLDFFRLFFTAEILDLLVAETNKYYDQYVTKHGPTKRQNFPVTADEFFAVVLHMGHSKWTQYQTIRREQSLHSIILGFHGSWCVTDLYISSGSFILKTIRQQRTDCGKSDVSLTRSVGSIVRTTVQLSV